MEDINLDDYYISIQSLSNFENNSINKWIENSKKPKKLDKKLKNLTIDGGFFSRDGYDVTSTDMVNIPFLIEKDGKSTIQQCKARIIHFYPSLFINNETLNSTKENDLMNGSSCKVDEDVIKETENVVTDINNESGVKDESVNMEKPKKKKKKSKVSFCDLERESKSPSFNLETNNSNENDLMNLQSSQQETDLNESCTNCNDELAPNTKEKTKKSKKDKKKSRGSTDFESMKNQDLSPIKNFDNLTNETPSQSVIENTKKCDDENTSDVDKTKKKKKSKRSTDFIKMEQTETSPIKKTNNLSNGDDVQLKNGNKCNSDENTSDVDKTKKRKKSRKSTDFIKMEQTESSPIKMTKNLSNGNDTQLKNGNKSNSDENTSDVDKIKKRKKSRKSTDFIKMEQTEYENTSDVDKTKKKKKSKRSTDFIKMEQIESSPIKMTKNLSNGNDTQLKNGNKSNNEENESDIDKTKKKSKLSFSEIKKEPKSPQSLNTSQKSPTTIKSELKDCKDFSEEVKKVKKHSKHGSREKSKGDHNKSSKEVDIKQEIVSNYIEDRKESYKRKHMKDKQNIKLENSFESEPKSKKVKR